jgi:hypothetical protein
VTLRRTTPVLILLLCSAVMLLGGQAKNIPTVSDLAPLNANLGSGISGDNIVSTDWNGASAALYANGANGVQSYLGAGGKDVDLVTYGSSRTLHFSFSTGDIAVWGPSGANLPQSFDAAVDFYGVNFFGPYESMGVGTTAQIHGVLQFQFNGQTYQLDYAALAGERTASNVWLITSDGAAIYAPFTTTSAATLSVQRRHGQVVYGSVAAPIQFQVKLQ